MKHKGVQPPASLAPESFEQQLDPTVPSQGVQYEGGTSDGGIGIETGKELRALAASEFAIGEAKKLALAEAEDKREVASPDKRSQRSQPSGFTATTADTSCPSDYDPASPKMKVDIMTVPYSPVRQLSPGVMSLPSACSTQYSHSNMTGKVDPFGVAGMCTAFVLSVTSGSTNATAFMALGMFVSHVTGTSTKIGMKAKIADWDTIEPPVLLLLSFIAGSAVCGLLIDRNKVNVRDALYGVAMMLVGVLLFLSIFTEKDTHAAYLASAASGMQNSVTTSYSGGVMRTTHLSGTVSDIGNIGGRLVKKMIMRRGIRSLSMSRRSDDFKKLVLQIVLLIGYIAGAVLGVALYEEFDQEAFAVPASICALGGLGYIVYRRVEKADYESPSSLGERTPATYLGNGSAETASS